MTVRFTLLLLIAATTALRGQKDSTNDYSVSGLKLAYTYSRVHNIEIGYGRGKIIPVPEMIGPAGYYGGFVNVGYAVADKQSMLTTRLSYQLMTVLPGARVSLINFTDFNKNQLIFLPEIGLSYNAVIAVMYGYNVYLTANRFDLSRHSFSISVIPYFWKN